MAEQQTWNPRYSAYARAFGRTESEQIEADTEMFPGGKMAGFIIGMGEQWTTFNLAHGYRRDDEKHLTDERHNEFDRWLNGDRIT